MHTLKRLKTLNLTLQHLQKLMPQADAFCKRGKTSGGDDWDVLLQAGAQPSLKTSPSTCGEEAAADAALNNVQNETLRL
jgi:hypothetical protein